MTSMVHLIKKWGGQTQSPLLTTDMAIYNVEEHKVLHSPQSKKQKLDLNGRNCSVLGWSARASKISGSGQYAERSKERS